MNWGYHIRSCFVSEPGYTMIGCDMDSIEARVTSHYTSMFDNGTYSKELLNGDPHQSTADSLGITRDKAKTLNYAILYGCGVGKISGILGCSMKDSKIMLMRYWDSKPGLKALKDNLEASLISRGVDLNEDLVKQRAYINALGGKRVYVRQGNALLNALIQASATVLFKEWYNNVCDRILYKNLDARILIAYHDELQLQCKPEDTKEVSKILEEGLAELKDKFNLNVDITGAACEGQSWYDTH